MRCRWQWRKVMRSTVRLQAAQNASRLSSAQKIHSARSNSAPVSTIAPRPSSFTIARVLVPFDVGEARELRHVLRMFGHLQYVESAAQACFRLHFSEIADEVHQSFARLHLEQAQQRRADVSSAARHLRDRQSGTRRRGQATRGVQSRPSRRSRSRQARARPCRPLRRASHSSLRAPRRVRRRTRRGRRSAFRRRSQRPQACR